MVETACTRFMTVARREWWLLAVTTAVAVAVAVVSTFQSPSRSTATATVSVDSSSPGRVRGVLLPDDLVRISTTARFRSAVASRAGVAVGDVSGGLRVSASGSPITVITVTCVSSKRENAERIARAAAEQIIEEHLAAIKQQIELREQRISISRDALERIDATADGSLTPQDVFARWSIEAALIDSQDALEALRAVYQYDGNMSTSTYSARLNTVRAAFGGLVLGVLAGALLVAAREHLLARRAV